MNYFYIVLLLNLFLKSKEQENKNCRVLVLEGGGDRGAYHAGAFH